MTILDFSTLASVKFKDPSVYCNSREKAMLDQYYRRLLILRPFLSFWIFYVKNHLFIEHADTETNINYSNLECFAIPSNFFAFYNQTRLSKLGIVNEQGLSQLLSRISSSTSPLNPFMFALEQEKELNHNSNSINTNQTIDQPVSTIVSCLCSFGVSVWSSCWPSALISVLLNLNSINNILWNCKKFDKVLYHDLSKLKVSLDISFDQGWCGYLYVERFLKKYHQSHTLKSGPILPFIISSSSIQWARARLPWILFESFCWSSCSLLPTPFTSIVRSKELHSPEIALLTLVATTSHNSFLNHLFVRSIWRSAKYRLCLNTFKPSNVLLILLMIKVSETACHDTYQIRLIKRLLLKKAFVCLRNFLIHSSFPQSLNNALEADPTAIVCDFLDKIMRNTYNHLHDNIYLGYAFLYLSRALPKQKFRLLSFPINQALLLKMAIFQKQDIAKCNAERSLANLILVMIYILEVLFAHRFRGIPLIDDL